MISRINRINPQSLCPAKVARFGSGGNPSSQRFTDLKEKPDPKPKRRISIRSALITVTGALGFWYGPATVQQVGNLAGRQVAEVRKMNPVADNRITGPEKAHSEREKMLPITNLVGDTYLSILIRWEALVLTLVAASRIRKKRSIRPEELFAELNRRGLTGKGMKVAVIDSGLVPTGAIRPDKLSFYRADDLKVAREPFDSIGHGTKVAHIIAEANPDAELIGISIDVPEQDKEMEENRNRVYEQAKESPEKLTLMEVRKVHAPWIQSLANGIRAAADQGAHAVNISLGLEGAVRQDNQQQLSAAMKDLRWANRKKRFLIPGSNGARKNEEKIQKLIRYTEKLSDFLHAHEKPEVAMDELKALYKPYFDALDYAHQKGTAVIVASGNSYGHWATAPNALGNVDPLCMVEHPALIVVASTDSDGTISDFSSKYNDAIQPLIAGNGSGEISTCSRGLSLLPTGNPSGTSYAAPDVAALYLKMKELDPPLMLEEAKKILIEAAGQAAFSPKQLEEIKEKVNAWSLRPSSYDRLSEEERVQEEIKKRVGYGTLAGNHHKAIYLTEQNRMRKNQPESAAEVS